MADGFDYTNLNSFVAFIINKYYPMIGFNTKEHEMSATNCAVVRKDQPPKYIHHQ
jgi:hypothetical protein